MESHSLTLSELTGFAASAPTSAPLAKGHATEDGVVAAEALITRMGDLYRYTGSGQGGQHEHITVPN
jgi:hypothetical protein